MILNGIFTAVYTYLAIRFYYFNPFFWDDLTFLSGHVMTPKEQLIDTAEAFIPIVLLVILLTVVSFFGKRHFEKWGWKERAGIALSAVFGIADVFGILFI